MDVAMVSGGRPSGFSDRDWSWQMGAISRTYSPVAAPARAPYQGYLTPMSQRKRFTCEGSEEVEGESKRVADAVSTEAVQLSGAVVEASLRRRGAVPDTVEPVEEEVGYCYQHLIADLKHRKAAKVKLGPSPTLLSLLRLPSEWFDISWMDSEVKCVRVRDGAWHVGRTGSVTAGLLLYEVAVGVRRFEYGQLGRILMEGPVRDWPRASVGFSPAWCDTLGGDRPSGATAFSVDPYGGKFGRFLNNPVGSLFHLAMHASAAGIKAPDQVVLHREEPGSEVNTGCYGGEYPHGGMPGVSVRSAAVVPRIERSTECVRGFRVVVGRPPESVAWAVEVPSVGAEVQVLALPGLRECLRGPVVWIVSQSDTVSFDVTLRGITALSFHVVDFKAALGTVDLGTSDSFSVGFPEGQDVVGGWIDDDSAGYCYLTLFRGLEHEKIRARLGPWPTLCDILRCDESDFNHVGLQRQGFQKTDRGWHVAEGLPSNAMLLLRVAASTNSDSEASVHSLYHMLTVTPLLGFQQPVQGSDLIGPY